MSREEGSVPVPGGGSLSKQPNFRREWDKEAFEAKAKARLAEEESLEEERERKKTAPAPIVQRAPLQRRTEELRLDKFEGSRQLVTGAQAQAGSFSAAYHCKVCDCVLRDSANYLLHINGRKHNRMLGMSMRAERSTLEEVKARFDAHREERDSSAASEVTAEQKAEAFLADFDERIRQREEADREEATAKRRAARAAAKGKGDGEGDEGGEGEAEEIDEEKAAMVAMGFDFAAGGFGGSRKEG
eukprot:CAMPEP_0185292584 /NCGR_PEP_ID=MMETSP1363-20130426/6192_1 /TAXON_ID=38817 /ORGANISM="Gephyrocapsa oceanica, Strain RCC1303" /LENGTH=243 /DNA_ID=CAMNT_0027888845 /DNA_START=29 /DNA_END=760 /DNA_ORIENTATION=-